MKIFVRNGAGSVGLNYMWLPTFIGMNSALIRELEQHVTPIMAGRALTDELLEEGSAAALQFLCERFPHVKGLEEYLDGLKFVEDA